MRHVTVTLDPYEALALLCAAQKAAPGLRGLADAEDKLAAAIRQAQEQPEPPEPSPAALCTGYEVGLTD